MSFKNSTELVTYSEPPTRKWLLPRLQNPVSRILLGRGSPKRGTTPEARDILWISVILFPQHTIGLAHST